MHPAPMFSDKNERGTGEKGQDAAMIAQAASRNDRFIAAPVPFTNVSTELRRQRKGGSGPN